MAAVHTFIVAWDNLSTGRYSKKNSIDHLDKSEDLTSFTCTNAPPFLCTIALLKAMGDPAHAYPGLYNCTDCPVCISMSISPCNLPIPSTLCNRTQGLPIWLSTILVSLPPAGRDESCKVAIFAMVHSQTRPHTSSVRRSHTGQWVLLQLASRSRSNRTKTLIPWLCSG